MPSPLPSLFFLRYRYHPIPSATMADSRTAVANWHLTLTYREGTTPDEVKAEVKKLAKRWAFQKERGEGKETKDEKEAKDGYVHWQIIMTLHKPARLSALVRMMKTTVLEGAHASATCTANRDKQDYAMKEHTRIEGPWRWDDDEPEEEPLDLVGLVMRPWQQSLLALIDESMKLPRKSIIYVQDEVGQQGKSTLVKYLSWKKWARCLPKCSKHEDIIKAAMSSARPTKNCYVVDIERQYKSQKGMESTWMAIEGIAGGRMYDTRYKFAERNISNPLVIVFGNMRYMDKPWLSEGRVQVKLIGYEQQLVVWNPKKEQYIRDYWTQVRKEEKEAKGKRQAEEDNDEENRPYKRHKEAEADAEPELQGLDELERLVAAAGH